MTRPTCMYCGQPIEGDATHKVWWDQMEGMQMSGWFHQSCLDFTADLHGNLAYDEGAPYPAHLDWTALIRARGKHPDAYSHIMRARMEREWRHNFWEDPAV
jgi:hypothetical protein